MKISTAHQRLARFMREEDVIPNPEKYLGPNYLSVLNFWLYLETLSKEQVIKLSKLYSAIDYYERLKETKQATILSEQTIPVGYVIAAWNAGQIINYNTDTFNTNYCMGYATLELIASHLFVEQEETFTFIPMFEKL
jgi:hypothetical protein